MGLLDNPPLMILPSGGLQNVSRFFPPLPGEQIDPIIGVTYLGTPVYSNLIFNSRPNPNTQEPNARTPDLVLDTVLMEVNMEKNVVRTPIQGRNGTVKEYISMGDYEIFIQGVIVSPEAQVVPKDTVNALRDLLELPSSLEVSSDFLQIFSVHNIVVLGYNIGQIMGSHNQIGFSIRAVSDQPIEVRET
jgi:hypothetical protein